MNTRLAPQTTTILRHLEKVGSISNVEAQALYKCRALPKRISEIDRAIALDMNDMRYIARETKKDATGQRYVRYYLKFFKTTRSPT